MNKVSNFLSIADFIDKETIGVLKQESIFINNYNKNDKNFWFSFDTLPSNVIEEYIFKTVNELGCPSNCVGAEWWVRVFNQDNQDHAFHVDLDVSLSRQKNICKTPEWSFVTYLSWDGGPTVVTNSAKYKDTDKLEYYPSTPSVIWMSNPKPGKIIRWTKPYIHGVFGGINLYGPRVTLMFNLWDSKPLEPECTEYDLEYNISWKSIDLNNIIPDKLPVLKGTVPTHLKIKGDRNMVTCNLCEGLPFGGTYMIIT